MNCVTQNLMANTLGVSLATLAKYRKLGMPYISLGPRLVRYDFDKVMEWFEARYSKAQ